MDTSGFRAFPFAALLGWWDANGRHDLPWRQGFDLPDGERAYRVWLAEILLQQTQVERVKVFYERMLARFPTVGSLAAADYETFFPYYKGLGYYSRARNMLRAAGAVVRDHAGVFPRGTRELRALPGVGAYTAEAVRAFAYDLPTLAVDTNLTRIFARYYLGDKGAPLPPQIIAGLIGQIREEGLSARAVNAALMDYGAMVSVANKAGVDFGLALPGCRFGETLGETEADAARSKKTFPSADSPRVVVLHEDHKRYFSAESDRYAPFVLPPGSDDPRRATQAYFLEKYGLEVSVRPVRRREYGRDDRPYIVMNAQIQTGSHGFGVYGRGSQTEWERHFFTE